MQQRSLLTRLLLLIIFVASGIMGCENTFEPFEKDHGLNFTMFGALDLTADTQWVRVMPVMDSLVSRSPNPIDAEVSLIRLSDGHKTVLNDSLFKFRDEYYAWNFWTTEPLQESEEYKIVAEASDGRTSSATLSIPPDFPTPLVQYFPRNERGWVYGTGIERVVVADGIYNVRIIDDGVLIKQGWIHVPHVYDVYYNENGQFEFELYDVRTIAKRYGVPLNSVGILDREVLVVSGTSDWPDFEGLLREEYVLPNLQSNVENGLGVVSGIVSKRIPMESCYNSENEIIGCPLID